MRKTLSLFIVLVMVFVCACSQDKPGQLVLLKGGTFKNTNSNFYGKNDTSISDFYIGKYEVTQKEWNAVMESNPSQFQGDNLPVEMVSWYDCVDYCNKRSEKEGLQPYYNIDKSKQDPENKSKNDTIKWIVTINKNANGYRLPTEAEWEYAADGGQKSKNYTYSGSNDVNKVAWYWKNTGDKKLSGAWSWPEIQANKNQTQSVGKKKHNELALYDMSGNVREWCSDWYIDNNGKNTSMRVWKGGGWIGDESCCVPSFRGQLDANGVGPDQGFRICRNK